MLGLMMEMMMMMVRLLDLLSMITEHACLSFDATNSATG
jgi:hypothetical protein